MKIRPTMKSKMRQLDLFVDERSLFEKLCDQANLFAGFVAVKKNDGSPGIDDVTIEELYNICKDDLHDIFRIRDAYVKWLKENPDKIDRSL